MATRSITRNVTVSGHRTSIRMEPTMWDALDELSEREGRTINEICTFVERRKYDSSLTAALRVLILSYFRAAATDEGHEAAGHGRSPSAVIQPSAGLSGRASANFAAHL